MVFAVLPAGFHRLHKTAAGQHCRQRDRRQGQTCLNKMDPVIGFRRRAAEKKIPFVFVAPAGVDGIHAAQEYRGRGRTRQKGNQGGPPGGEQNFSL